MMKLLSPNGGQLDETKIFNQSDPVALGEQRKSQALTEEIQKRMSPPGALGLPDLLEKRRLEFGIIDKHFEYQDTFDRCHVYQIDYMADETVGSGSTIIRPGSTVDRDRDTANRGILISAGLLALDHLHSNGYELGHIVRFVKLAVMREPDCYVPGLKENVFILRSGDLTGSEDLRQSLRSGAIKIGTYEDADGNTRYCYVDRDGKQLRPQLGFMPADM